MPGTATQLSAPAPLTIDRPLFEIDIVRNVRIPTADSDVTLAADLFLPVSAGIVPALVTTLPYRKDVSAGLQWEPMLRWFAHRGYAGLLVDFRGTGSSDGRHRPPFHPDEADDGVAAVEWTAGQSWCSGNVGMWGHSYGAIMAMRTATRRPPGLKAIAPVMGMIDMERDFVHPDGARGLLGSLAMWGTQTLFNQLLPPLRGYHTAVEQRRWRERLRQADPWLLDLFRHAPGDPEWRARAIDPSRITVPAFCVAGWRDLFCEGTIRAFELIRSPKKLLAGPWMHTMPQLAPAEPADFPALLLRWWDHWLRGVDTGFLDGPAVTAYVQGATPGWRQFAAWPPADGELRFGAGSDLALRQDEAGPHDHVLAEYRPDPTIGPLAGLSGIPSDGVGMPLDQHDEDMRSLASTAAPLPHDLLIMGRPQVTVWLAGGSRVGRLVVRLSDVDTQDRSTLITMGVLTLPETNWEQPYAVTLTPTCYRLPLGHRLRVTVSDADFPRLWPTAVTDPLIRLAGLDLRLPTTNDLVGSPVTLPSPPDAGTEPVAWARPNWSVARDLVNDGVEVSFGGELAAPLSDNDCLVRVRHQMTARVTREAPDNAVVRGSSTASIRMATGEAIEVRVELHMTSATLLATGVVEVDGAAVFTHRWES